MLPPNERAGLPHFCTVALTLGRSVTCLAEKPLKAPLVAQ
jgi:hypothetical protein